MSQFLNYVVFAALFYVGGLVIENNKDKLNEDGSPKIDAESVFIALFSIFFAAFQAGQVSAMGPDIGKATAAAKRIFQIIETPSKINAVEINSDPEAKKIEADLLKGVIEFKDVWFRYPTRNTDWVF